MPSQWRPRPPARKIPARMIPGPQVPRARKFPGPARLPVNMLSGPKPPARAHPALGARLARPHRASTGLGMVFQ